MTRGFEFGGGTVTVESDVQVDAEVTLPQVIVSALYTPTLTAITNIDTISMNSTLASYLRVGDLVFFWSTLYINPTATGACEFKMTVPIAADFSGGTARANGVIGAGFADENGRIQANTADNTLAGHFIASVTTEHTFCVAGSYRLA